jgi:hypothetical protein
VKSAPEAAGPMKRPILRRTVSLLAGFAIAGFTTAAFAAEPANPTGDSSNTPGSSGTHYDPYPIALLRELDKITARAHTIQVPVDRPFKLGTLSITVKACYKRPPEETPETAAFLIIYDEKPDEPPQKYFSGWMFASSPALSALEHPVYDLWVLNCRMDLSKSIDQPVYETEEPGPVQPQTQDQQPTQTTN